MKIPKYWAKSTARVRGDRGEFDLTFWRWSDTSQTDAAQAADARAREMAARFTSFEDLDRYGYADRPLREEIIESITSSDGRESAVVTRNSYGALILNAARVMFIDIDFEAKSGGLSARLRQLSGKAPSSPEADHLARIEEWARRNPQWSMRVYRTFGGLRGLITNELFDPIDPGSTDVLKSLNSDPLYVRLCRAQECFRARLTPKPWRCGTPNPPSRYPWPTTGAEMAQRQWERTYEYAANRYTTCKLVKQFRSASMPSDVARIVEMHDRYACRGDHFDLA
ncbi:MAG: hypothetical protein HY870_02145 [Chloroflexi bacterium]|nr:hypothetical protein [Chloroflexota bacterium]